MVGSVSVSYFLRQLSLVHKSPHPRAWPRLPAIINTSAARCARTATPKSRIPSIGIPITKASSRRRNRRNAPAVRAVTGRQGGMLLLGTGHRSLLSRKFPRSRCWTLASHAIARHSHAPTSDAHHTRSMASCAPTAIPFTAPRRRRIYLPKTRRICATAATRTCARSFRCPSSTASTKVS